MGRAPWRVSDAWTTSPGPYHLDGRAWTAAPGALAAASAHRIAKPGGSAPPRGLWSLHPGGAPLQTARLGAQGVGGKARSSGQPLLVNQAEKVIPLSFPGYFDGVR